MIRGQYQMATAMKEWNDPGQDRVAVLEWSNDIVLVIADGAGGLPGGAKAAQMVIDRIAASEGLLLDRQDDLALCRLLDEVGRAIADDPEAGETTAIVVVISDGLITGASIGDSRAWLFVDEDEYHLTASQSRKPLLGGGGVSTPFYAALDDGVLLMATDGFGDYTELESVKGLVLSNTLDTAANMLVESVRLPSGALWDDVSVLLCRRREPIDCG